MTKIATIEVTVPDTIKPDDDVFNYMRKHQCNMRIVDFKDDPHEPPLVKGKLAIKVVYEAKGAEDATKIGENINIALQSVKGVVEVELL